MTDGTERMESDDAETAYTIPDPDNVLDYEQVFFYFIHFFGPIIRSIDD